MNCQIAPLIQKPVTWLEYDREPQAGKSKVTMPRQIIVWVVVGGGDSDSDSGGEGDDR